MRIVDEPSGFSPRGAAIAVLSRLGRRARSRARVRTNDCTIGVMQAGHLTDPRALVALLDHVDQTTELVCHPGITDADLQRAYDWGYEWSAETHALCDSTVREAIASRGIALAAP